MRKPHVNISSSIPTETVTKIKELQVILQEQLCVDKISMTTVIRQAVDMLYKAKTTV